MAGKEHDIVLKMMIKYFQNKKYAIKCADFNEYQKCEKITTHVPDIVAIDSMGLLHIGEAESCKALERYQTVKQFLVFSDLVMSDNDNRKIPFYIGIPNRCDVRLSNMLHDLKIKSKVEVLLCDIDM